MDARGNIDEIFDSVQGEGPMTGVRQIFIRFGGCNLSCAFCDTPQARRPVATCKVETEPASGRYDFIPNTVSVADVHEVVKRLRVPGHHSVAITGGEPMVQADFLRSLLPLLTADGLKVYLETNATYPEELPEIVEQLEYVAADIKIPSCTGEPERFEVNLEFLKNCSVPNLFVKMVLTEECAVDEVLTAVRLVSSSGRKAVVVIQPVTGRRGEVGIGGGALLDVQAKALEIYPDVRVIPRTHQLLRLS